MGQMRKACSMHGTDEKSLQNFIGKPEGKRPLEILRRTLKYIIKMVLK
jgi:hypothetical protein